MIRRKDLVLLTAGILTGAALAAPLAQAAETLAALPSTQRFYVDGEQVDLEAYAINGHNYVQLRDIGRAADFAVAYYAATNSVWVDTAAPYVEESAAPAVPEDTASAPVTQTGEGFTIHTDHWSREDFSQQANPAVFTPIYDRALYNAIRQTMVDGTGPDAPGDQFAYTMVEDERYSEVAWVLSRVDGIIRYERHVPITLKNYYEYLDYFAVAVKHPEVYQDAIVFIQPVLQEAEDLSTDRARVTFLNDYLRSLLTYELGATSGIPRTLSPHTEELPAACGSYARAFSFLCDGADIPCFTISSEDHTWNMVYVDGAWLHVDVSSNDIGTPNSILMAETVTGQNHIDTDPDATEFLKELLVSGSTK